MGLRLALWCRPHRGVLSLLQTKWYKYNIYILQEYIFTRQQSVGLNPQLSAQSIPCTFDKTPTPVLERDDDVMAIENCQNARMVDGVSAFDRGRKGG